MVSWLRKKWSHWPKLSSGYHYSYNLQFCVQGHKFHVTFQRISSHYFCQFRGQSYANILSHEGTKNVMEQREAFPIPPEMGHPSSPTHCCSAWTEQCTSQPCLILLRLHTRSIVNHTSSTPFNSLPHLRNKYMNIKHGNLWRKIMVSFIFMKQVMSAWGASESPPSGAKQDTEQGLQSHLPTWNQMVGNMTSFNALYSGKEDLTNSTIWHVAPLYQTAILMVGFPKKIRDEQIPNKSQHCDWDFSFNMPRDILIVYFPKFFPAVSPNHTKVFARL